MCLGFEYKVVFRYIFFLGFVEWLKLSFFVGVGYGCVDKIKDGGGEVEIFSRVEEGSNRECYFNC